jgi:predicted nicotinamide N-methyase
VLIGDPRRRYLPAEELTELARYDVRTTTDLEDLQQKAGYVFRVRSDGDSAAAKSVTKL